MIATNRSRILDVVRILPVLLAVILAACAIGGCVTTDESDIPWNTPQPWEGAPQIPGLNQ